MPPLRVMISADSPPGTLPALVKGSDVAAFTLGGEVFEPWSWPEVQAVRVRYRLPVWAGPVQLPADGAQDGRMAAGKLYRYGMPARRWLALDMGSESRPGYVAAFGHELRPRWRVMVRAVPEVLPDLPALDGHWIAGFPAPGPGEGNGLLTRGALAAQWADMGAYELSVIRGDLKLWKLPASPTARIAQRARILARGAP